jgi:hypothetical protein
MQDLWSAKFILCVLKGGDILMCRRIWKSKLNPFGNYDNPEPPVWYMPLKPFIIRWFMWSFVRNPLHNFMFYWIGLAGKPHLRRCDEVFSSIGKWNVILPFVSYNGKRIRCYIGWRERNNFGIKFNIKRKNS